MRPTATRAPASTGRAPRDRTCEGLNDGVNRTVLDVRTNAAATSNYTPRADRFMNAPAYKHFGLNDIVSNGDGVIRIAEIRLQSPQKPATGAGSTATVGSLQPEAYAFGGGAYATTHATDLWSGPTPGETPAVPRVLSLDFNPGADPLSKLAV